MTSLADEQSPKAQDFFRSDPVLSTVINLHPTEDRRSKQPRKNRSIAWHAASGMLMALIVGLAAALSVFSRGQSQMETFTIEASQRRAIVYANARPPVRSGAPVVFVFHGHGGTAQNVARRFRIHELWPEATVVYMQGEPGVQGITY